MRQTTLALPRRALPAVAAIALLLTCGVAYCQGDANEGGWWTKADWVTAFATSALVFVGLGQIWLFLVQLRYIRESLDDAKTAADAARDSADAAKAGAEASKRVDRSYLFADVTFPFHQLAKSDAAINTATVTFNNFGKTPAVLSKFRATHFFSPGFTYPQEFPSTIVDLQIPDGMVIAPNGSQPFPIKFVMPPENWAQVERIALTFGFYGQIDYTDVFGDFHVTSFCWHYGAHEFQGSLHISPSKLNRRT
jgi:hypothetical protein